MEDSVSVGMYGRDNTVSARNTTVRRQERKRLGGLKLVFSGLAYELCHRKIVFVALSVQSLTFRLPIN
jgi:hypothetical protein